MISKKLQHLAAVGLAAALVQSVSAQPTGQTNYSWTGAGDGATWDQAANWSAGIVPVNNGTTFQIFLGTGFPTPTPTPIVIGASDNITLNDQVFGPEWGETLNIYGTVHAGFGFAPVGALGGPMSVVNLYGNASYTSGDSIFIGDMFWFNGGPDVSMNLYGNSQVSTKYLALGGHLNIYGGAVTILTSLLTGTPTAGAWNSPLSTDATRLVDVSGGQLILPGDATTQVNDMITRGILQGYGVVGAVALDKISDPGYTIVTGVVPEPASVALLGLGGLVGAFFLRRRSAA